MNIVLIGADGTGKSTLAEELSIRLCMPIYHGEGSHDNKLSRWDKLKRYSGVIFDRVYPIDDIVYSHLRSEEPEFRYEDLPQFEDTEKWLVIYLTSSRAKENLAKRGDDEITVDDIDLICGLYQFALLTIPFLEVDNSDYDAADVIVEAYTSRLDHNKRLTYI